MSFLHFLIRVGEKSLIIQSHLVYRRFPAPQIELTGEGRKGGETETEKSRINSSETRPISHFCNLADRSPNLPRNS